MKKSKPLVGLTTNQLKLLRELRDDHGGVLTLQSRVDRSDYEALKKSGCIQIFPLYLTDIRCEITEAGRAMLLKYGIRPPPEPAKPS
jgi:hypothetical protein